MSIPATIGEGVTLVLVMEDGKIGLYPQAEIYSGATLEATIDLTDLGKGRYEGSWVPTTVGAFTSLFSVYQDASHTIELTPIMISREAEQIFVTQSGLDDLAVMIVRLLGLNKENTYIDNTSYDGDSMLLTARLRVFDSKANAQAATEGGTGEAGTIAEYTVESNHYGPNKMRTYRMVKE